MKDVLRVVYALNLGRTEVKADGVYRTFNNGDSVKLAEGNLKEKKFLQRELRSFNA